MVWWEMLKRMFERKITVKYPFEKLEFAERGKYSHRFNREKCISCGICEKICPNRAIVMVEVEGKKYPRIDMSKCCFCALCEEFCPTKALILVPETPPPVFKPEELIINP